MNINTTLNCSQPQVNGSMEWHRCSHRNTTTANVNKFLTENFVSKTAFDALSALYNATLKGWVETNKTLEGKVTELNSTQTKLNTTHTAVQSQCDALATELDHQVKQGLITNSDALSMSECSAEITNDIIEKMKKAAELLGFTAGMAEGSSYCIEALKHAAKIAEKP